MFETLGYPFRLRNTHAGSIDAPCDQLQSSVKATS